MRGAIGGREMRDSAPVLHTALYLRIILQSANSTAFISLQMDSLIPRGMCIYCFPDVCVCFAKVHNLINECNSNL